MVSLRKTTDRNAQLNAKAHTPSGLCANRLLNFVLGFSTHTTAVISSQWLTPTGPHPGKGLCEESDLPQAQRLRECLLWTEWQLHGGMTLVWNNNGGRVGENVFTSSRCWSEPEVAEGGNFSWWPPSLNPPSLPSLKSTSCDGNNLTSTLKSESALTFTFVPNVLLKFMPYYSGSLASRIFIDWGWVHFHNFDVEIIMEATMVEFHTAKQEWRVLF